MGQQGERPYVGFGEVGDGYGMPSSHSQAAAFLVAWGVGYAMTLDRRKTQMTPGAQSKTSSASPAHGTVTLDAIRTWRIRIYLFGLVLWSILVAYSR